MFDKSIKIETEHLIMRPFTEVDDGAMFKIQSHPEMTKYTPDEPWKSMEDAKEFIKLALWLYELDRPTFRHFFAVVEKESGNLLGYCGIGGIAYDRTQNEVFYAIYKDYWGKGYATEAGKAMLEYAFCQLGLTRIIGVVHTENKASMRVMEKIGLKIKGLINGLPEEFNSYNGENLYTLNRDEYMEGGR